jgi:hypothetical protein
MTFHRDGDVATEEVPPEPVALAAMASSYGIDIVGPPPTL